MCEASYKEVGSLQHIKLLIVVLNKVLYQVL